MEQEFCLSSELHQYISQILVLINISFIQDTTVGLTVKKMFTTVGDQWLSEVL